MPISRLSDKNDGITIIQDTNTDEDTTISYCSDCKEFRNKLYRLVPLITLDSDNSPLPADHESWKQCPYCYTKVLLTN